MVICCSVRGRVVPESGPPVTRSRWGSLRPGLAGRGGRAGRGRAFGRCRVCLRLDGDWPNRSVRTTPTAVITKSHRTARNASLIRRRVSVLIGLCVLGGLAVAAFSGGVRGRGLGPG